MSRRPTRIAALLFILFVAAFSANAQYSGGSGTASDPWQIATVADLLALGENTAHYVDHFILIADIDLADHHASSGPFGTALIAADNVNDPPDQAGEIIHDGTPFTGVFDGAGHTIRNLTIDDAGAERDYIALFGYATNPAAFLNITLQDIDIFGGGFFVAGFVSRNHGATLTNCHVTGTLHGYRYVGPLVGYQQDASVSGCTAATDTTATALSSTVGGLIGRNFRSPVSDCHATGTVSGVRSVGGLLGSNVEAALESSYATGHVTSAGDNAQYAGGLVGYTRDCDTTACYATGDVRGVLSVGGLVGNHVRDAGLHPIQACYAIGAVTGDDFVGGLAGENGFGPITESYAVGAVTSGGENVGGLVGNSGDPDMITRCYFLGASGPDNDLGMPLSETAMRQQASFAGFDFDDDWAIAENESYPYLLAFTPPVIDCNANGAPDHLEPDCNSNGLPDDCDLAAGTSVDANANAVPDECEGLPAIACPVASALLFSVALLGLCVTAQARRPART